jgi:hypothetical protein
VEEVPNFPDLISTIKGLTVPSKLCLVIVNTAPDMAETLAKEEVSKDRMVRKSSKVNAPAPPTLHTVVLDPCAANFPTKPSSAAIEVNILPPPPVVLVVEEVEEVEDEEAEAVVDVPVLVVVVGLDEEDEVVGVVWFKKKSTIIKLASGPVGSVYDPEELPPDQACPMPVTVMYLMKVSPVLLLA